MAFSPGNGRRHLEDTKLKDRGSSVCPARMAAAAVSGLNRSCSSKISFNYPRVTLALRVTSPWPTLIHSARHD